jgi:hypothetical protein
MPGSPFGLFFFVEATRQRLVQAFSGVPVSALKRDGSE